MSNIVIRFDMRLPSGSAANAPEAYTAALDMAAWADENAIDLIALSEHHNTDDGYLPSPLPMAAAIAARTSHILLNVSALILPLHDPIRAAEDIAVVDLIARGRMSITFGLGYRECEYDAFGVDWKTRAKRLEENVHVMRRAWTGEPFEHRGTTVQVLPRPFSDPHPFLVMGGGSVFAARRAGRSGMAFSPSIDDEEIVAAYHEAARKHGLEHPMVFPPGYPSTTFIAEDPDAAWAELGPHMLADALGYGRWSHPTRRAYAESQATDVASLRAEGKYRVLTPDEAVAEIRDTGQIVLVPLVGGVPVDAGWRSLELYAAKVAPRVAA